MTRNGAGTGNVSFPSVTCRSCITSSSADWTELDLELGAVGPEDARADEVARHEVGRELHAVERAAEHVGDGLDRQRLREAGHSLDQQVTARQQPDEGALEQRVLARDHAPDLVRRAFDCAVGAVSLADRSDVSLLVQGSTAPLVVGEGRAGDLPQRANQSDLCLP
jgi:hypothetical protein